MRSNKNPNWDQLKERVVAFICTCTMLMFIASPAFLIFTWIRDCSRPKFDFVEITDLDKFKKVSQKKDRLFKKNSEGLSVLHFAAMGNTNLDIIKFIIEKGLNTDEKDSLMRTPLFYSMYNSNPEITEYFIENTAEINCQDHKGNTALHLILRLKTCDLMLVNSLIKHGADVNLTNNKGNTPLLLYLHYENKQLEMVDLLVKAGADVNVQNKLGFTPLIVAAWSKSPRIVTYLLNNGADPDKKYKGKTAWDYIQKNKDLKNTEAYRLLKKLSIK